MLYSNDIVVSLLALMIAGPVSGKQNFLRLFFFLRRRQDHDDSVIRCTFESCCEHLLTNDS